MPIEATGGRSMPTLTVAHPDRCLPGWRALLRNDDEHAIVARYGKAGSEIRRPALLLIDFQHCATERPVSYHAAPAARSR